MDEESKKLMRFAIAMLIYASKPATPADAFRSADEFLAEAEKQGTIPDEFSLPALDAQPD